VKLTGFKDNPYAYMSRADIFVLSSLYEGFPNVLIEAMICGCPVVSTDCRSGPIEIIKNNFNGILVPVGDLKSLENAIEDVITDNVKRHMVIKNALKSIEKYQVDKICADYLRIIRNPSSNL